jgi:hypothetical protein
MRDHMRVAIVSTPRSGNTWIRWVLRDSLSLQELSVHNYLDVQEIPDRCVFQLHWYREPNFQSFLSAHGFQVITVARHPLDVLVSVLHFVRHEPETARWLGGNCELPENLASVSPASDQFLEYATSFGSENLLCVTYQWWHERGAIKARYEDFVAAPEVEAARLADALGGSADQIPGALASNSIDSFKALPNRHGWQGRPGLWRELIPYENASTIFEHHRSIFERLGYTIESTRLTHDEAESRWESLLR